MSALLRPTSQIRLLLLALSLMLLGAGCVASEADREAPADAEPVPPPAPTVIPQRASPYLVPRSTVVLKPSRPTIELTPLLADGHSVRHIGEYTEAAERYRAIIRQGGDAPAVAEARYGLAVV